VLRATTQILEYEDGGDEQKQRRMERLLREDMAQKEL